MNICPGCGMENPGAARFCNNCGRALGAPGNGSAAPPGKKALSFWWILAIIFAGCALFSAVVFFFAGRSASSGETQNAIAEPVVDIMEYTPDPDVDYSAAGLDSAADTPLDRPGAETPEPGQSGASEPTAQAEDDVFLFKLVQGMWVSDADFEGCCTRLLIHGSAAAMATANPLKEGAEPRAWKDGEWDSDAWLWGDCRVENGVLYITDSEEEIPFKILPVSDYEFSLEFNGTDTEEGDRVTFYCIQPPEEFSLKDFLIGDWVSEGAIKSDSSIHGLFKFRPDGSGEIGRAKDTSGADVYSYEKVFSIQYATDGMTLAYQNQNDESSEFTVNIQDAFTMSFGDETFRRIG